MNSFSARLSGNTRPNSASTPQARFDAATARLEAAQAEVAAARQERRAAYAALSAVGDTQPLPLLTDTERTRLTEADAGEERARANLNDLLERSISIQRQLAGLPTNPDLAPDYPRLSKLRDQLHELAQPIAQARKDTQAALRAANTARRDAARINHQRRLTGVKGEAA